MSLLDLARQFDALPVEDYEGRIAVAEQMKPLLGERLDDFERLHETKVGARHRLPAVGALADMGLVECNLPAAQVLEVLGHWRESEYEIGLFKLGEGLLGSLRDSRPQVSADTLADWLETAEEAIHGEPTDWDRAVRSLRGSFMCALGRTETTEN